MFPNARGLRPTPVVTLKSWVYFGLCLRSEKAIQFTDLVCDKFVSYLGNPRMVEEMKSIGETSTRDNNPFCTSRTTFPPKPQVLPITEEIYQISNKKSNDAIRDKINELYPNAASKKVFYINKESAFNKAVTGLNTQDLKSKFGVSAKDSSRPCFYSLKKRKCLPNSAIK